ncbi:hypothetical protein CANCADRAFT_3278 [Tortispora caseinolytica NRRL Y-17796]|uniref:Long chronological lifespan protein 2 n=1 Tax=Tortispora caseinolytica NRRL Y-17796 TaxID=767744 RepID=A0A1E4TA98_9ASCO|nr:hypothetical protein CANCADRAFT_3278 [Tortispora caseinolytica NRRL Y-17796]
MRVLLLAGLAYAQFGDFFGFGGNRQPSKKAASHDIYLNLNKDLECTKYLCPDSFACVDKPIDCPCSFPESEVKCILPDKSSYVCISKPDTDSGRTCDFVNKAYNGKI